MVENAQQAGYDFLGLRLVPATQTEPQHDSQGNTALIRETAQRLQDSGLTVMDIEIFRLQAHTDIDQFEGALEAGRLLGATHALAAPQDGDRHRLAETLHRFCETASRHGLVVDLEPTPWYEVSTLRECASLIAATGRQDLGIVVDMIHFDRTGETPDSIRALAADHFRYAQLCDAPAMRPADLDTLLLQARAERLMPGDGGLDLAAILQALPSSLPLALEIPMQSLAGTMPVRERSRRMLAKAKALDARIGHG